MCVFGGAVRGVLPVPHVLFISIVQPAFPFLSQGPVTLEAPPVPFQRGELGAFHR